MLVINITQLLVYRTQKLAKIFTALSLLVGTTRKSAKIFVPLSYEWNFLKLSFILKRRLFWEMYYNSSKDEEV
jgi:hypothetical protein